MKKLSNKERSKQLAELAALPDDQIDTSDIPELTEEQFRHAVRSRFYRPIKKPVTMRLDADVIDWLKKDGPGYQTKANALLRQEMIRAYGEKKQPERVKHASGVRRKSHRARSR